MHNIELFSSRMQATRCRKGGIATLARIYKPVWAASQGGMQRVDGATGTENQSDCPTKTASHVLQCMLTGSSTDLPSLYGPLEAQAGTYPALAAEPAVKSSAAEK